MTANSDDRLAISAIIFKLASDLDIRRVRFGRSPCYVLHNRRSDHYFMADSALYQLLKEFDGQRDLGAILAAQSHRPSSLSKEELLDILPSLLQHSIVDAEALPSALKVVRQKTPTVTVWQRLSSVLFVKFDIIGLRRSLAFWQRLLGWVFCPTGFLIWLALVCSAIYAIAQSSRSLSDAMVYLTSISTGQLILLYSLFIVLKLLHELGHAVACVHYAAREGVKVPLIRFGLAIFAGLPFPYTNTSSAWLLQVPRHRVMVGIAGVYLESFVGAFVAIFWFFSEPGLLQAVLAQLLLVLGVSTFLFNLNPLVRLDGYYILIDLLGLPNLATRSSLAIRRLMAFVLGTTCSHGRFDLGDIGLVSYWIASLVYRCIVLGALFWFFYEVDLVLGILFGCLVGSLIAAKPLISTLSSLIRNAPDRRQPLCRLVLIGTGLTAFFGLLPLNGGFIAEGVVDRPGIHEVYATADGFIGNVAPYGATGKNREVFTLSNPERDTKIRQLEFEHERLAIESRLAMDAAPAAVAVYRQRQKAIEEQLSELQSERKRQVVVLADDEVWYPLEAETLEGMWLPEGDSRVMGIIQGQSPAKIRVFLDQHIGADLAAELQEQIVVTVRPMGDPDKEVTMRIERIYPTVSTKLPTAALGVLAGGSIVTNIDDPSGRTGQHGLFEVVLTPQESDRKTETWRHGQRIVAHFGSPSSSLFMQAWHHLHRLLLQRSVA